MRTTVACVACTAALAWGCSAAGDGGSTANDTDGKGPTSSAAGNATGSPNQPSLGVGGSLPNLGPIAAPVEEKCEAVLELTVRDFQPTHPDFESYSGLNDIGCGMVAPVLGADTKPTFASGIGTMKRVVAGDWANLTFASCEDWKGWNPPPVITDQTSFDQWYRDTPGVNETVQVPVTLTPDASGNLVYDSTAFFPIDGMGFGNTPGQQHNFHFTTEAHVRFGYIAGQKFTFRGDDDLWIYVNGKLALDLGGMHLPIAATIDFDKQAAELGISPGGTYQMDIFHAERHTNESNFRIETNIRCFEPVVVR
jgi:fibro-slime domain-containing protein